MRIKPLLFGLGALLVAGAAYGALRLFAPADDHALQYAPKDSSFYVNAFLDPSTSQKRAIADLLENFPEAETPEKAQDALARLFDQPLEEIGLSFEDDVQPWLGDQVAAFALAPEEPGDQGVGAALIASNDHEAAQAAVDRARAHTDQRDVETKSYKGAEYEVGADDTAVGFLGDFLVVGDEGGLKAAVDASEGESLEDSKAFDEATEDLVDDRVLLYYVDVGQFLEAAPGAGPIGQLPFFQAIGAQGRSAGALFVTPESVVFETSSDVPEKGVGAELGELSGRPGILAELPRDAWAAVTIPEFGRYVRTLIDAIARSFPGTDPSTLPEQFKAQTGLGLERDLLSWMGDLGLFVQGTDLASLGGGAVIESRDANAPASVLPRVRVALTRLGLGVDNRDFEGRPALAIRERPMPESVNVVAGERVVIAYGRDATSDALAADSTLAENESFREAADGLGDGYTPAFFLDLDRAEQAAENFGLTTGAGPAYERDVKPWLEPLSYFVAGARRDGDSVMQRIVTGVR